MEHLHGPDKVKDKSSLFKCIVIVAAACLVHGVMQGVHNNYGIMLNGLLESTGIDYASISFCIGVGALVYGFAQPFLGMLALKRSNVFVILLGILFMVIGLIATPLCRNFFSLLLFFGLILPFGTTGLCFGIVMGAITPVIGEKRAAAVSGIIQASAGVGDALMSPGLQTLIAELGIQSAMWLLVIPFLLMIPIILWLGRTNKRTAVTKEKTEPQVSLIAILRSALGVKDYRLLVISFATCGFNMSIIENHLFSQFLAYGISGSAASLALTVYGIATMIGAAGAGFLGVKFPMKNVLGSVYAVRVLISLGFIFLPKSAAFAFIATALLGLSGDSTVPPTSGIISKKFGAKKMAVLYGFTLIGHQIGAFTSSYLGGVFVEHGLGYTPLWIINMCLAAIAAAASFSIQQEK
ncbi:MAG: MFS transporter [Oscillospiraceae bacterium]|nr:MFS transporter [Oscillospiraceae bacterium]